ncbi:MAG: methylated-DNA--[protein]-cysteine S-methyltransferase [Planctomycetaceae bacterium]|nr:methylated-DNA--[protein]-cysteine S-methyltransferase [Planctomycetaceae bacterium]
MASTYYAYTVFQTAAVKMVLAEEGSVLTNASFCSDRSSAGCAVKDAQERTTPFLKEVLQQLKEYFSGNRRVFEIPVALKGTPFQEEVWNVLQKIPFGETRSYGYIAAQIGRPKSYRAVGSAAHCNPVSVIVPCHRVVGSDGSLTGYAGGLELKRMLLENERQRYPR